MGIQRAPLAARSRRSSRAADGGDHCRPEFRRQSQLLAHAWKPQVRSHLVLPGLNHFSIVDAFAERGQPLFEEALGLF